MMKFALVLQRSESKHSVTGKGLGKMQLWVWSLFVMSMENHTERGGRHHQ